MKKSIFTLAIAAFIAGSLTTSCNSTPTKIDAAKEDVNQASKDLEKAKANYTTEYNQFKLESDEKITANEKLIADLKEYSKNKKKEAKINYEKSIDDMEKQNQAMKEKVKNYKEEGNDKWVSFKDEFNRDMNELGKAIKDLTKNNVK